MHMERKQFTAVSGDSVDDNVGDKVSDPPIQFNAKADSGKSNNLCVQHIALPRLFSSSSSSSRGILLYMLCQRNPGRKVHGCQEGSRGRCRESLRQTHIEAEG